jgi:hypothetical protein
MCFFCPRDTCTVLFLKRTVSPVENRLKVVYVSEGIRHVAPDIGKKGICLFSVNATPQENQIKCFTVQTYN